MRLQEAKSEVITYWVEKADEALESAVSEAGSSRLGFAVNRCYYAAFYAASAVLLNHGHRFTKHSGVRAAVHKHLVKTAKLSSDLGQLYDRLFHERQQADYVELVRYELDEVQTLISETTELVTELQGCLDPDET